MPKQFDLVFEGGGAKGSTFVGALKAFFQAGLSPRRVVGTSAGAITATLLAAGYTPEELLQAVNEKLPDGKPRFSTFMDVPSPQDFSPSDIANSTIMGLLEKLDIPGLPGWIESSLDQKIIDALLKSSRFCQIFSFVELGGLYAGDMFLAWLQEKLAAKGFAANVTLLEFQSKVSHELSVVTSDTDSKIMRVLNHRTAPNLPLAWAVRMSMSIPFVWREVIWQDSWGLYLGQSLTGHRFVDGGLLSNFPIALVDEQPEPGSLAAQVMGTDTQASAADTLGLMIDESLPVPNAPPVPNSSDNLLAHSKLVERVERLVDTMTEASNNAEVAAHENLVCHLPAQGYGTTEFDMSAERLQALVDGGYQAMKDYLLTHLGIELPNTP